MSNIRYFRNQDGTRYRCIPGYFANVLEEDGWWNTEVRMSTLEGSSYTETDPGGAPLATTEKSPLVQTGKNSPKDDGKTAVRPVGVIEAREIAQRFIDQHFGNKAERPRASIPCNPDRDDDLRMMAFIGQTADMQSELQETKDELKRVRMLASDQQTLITQLRATIEIAGEHITKHRTSTLEQHQESLTVLEGLNQVLLIAIDAGLIRTRPADPDTKAQGGGAS